MTGNPRCVGTAWPVVVENDVRAGLAHVSDDNDLGGGALRLEGYLGYALAVARTVSLAPSWGACSVEEAGDDRLVALGVAGLAAAAT